MPSNATLVLRVGGDLTEVAPDDVVGYLRGVRAPTVRGLVDSLHPMVVSQLNRGNKVNLVLSKGSEPIAVKDFPYKPAS